MKEQDAAHSSLSVCPFCGLLPEWVNESLPDGHFYIRCPHCHIVMKEDRRDKVIGMWNRRAELTRLRSELQQKDESYYALMENAASLMERGARRISDLIQLFIDTTGKHPDDLKKQSQIIDYENSRMDKN